MPRTRMCEDCERKPGATARPLPCGYRQREPEKTVLYKVVQRNLETFLAENPGLPRYVEEEFRRYLDCGILSKGHIVLKCQKCGETTVVAFSCKTKTFCPSCLTRRMHAVAMDLVERVLPVAPDRHWVLAFPMEIRFHLARDEVLLRKLREIFVRSVCVWLRTKARGIGVKHAHTGAIAFTQRFSARLLLYPHIHCVIPDGVFAEDEAGKLVFHKIKPKDDDIQRIAERIARKSKRLIERIDGDTIDPNALDIVRGQALQGELAIQIVPVEQPTGRLVANVDGFSLQAARHLHENDRPGLEFLLRYVLRPPLSLERLHELPSGKIVLGFKKPLANGIAAIELSPMAFMRRLASIVAPPGNHDMSYFGVFAAHSKWRRKLVGIKRKDPEDCRTHPGCKTIDDDVSTMPDVIDPLFGREELLGDEEGERYIPWAQLMKRVHGIDVLKCKCGGARKVMAYVTEPKEIRESLEKLGLWKEPPKIMKARGPPMDLFDRPSQCDGVDPPAQDFVA